MKKLAVTIICILTITFSFILPITKADSFIFAETTIPAGWTSVTNDSQLVDAFKAYCKSRNLAINGSILDAVTSFTTSSFNNACRTLGIDSSELQAEIAYKTDNTGLNWFFTSTGISAYNRIFAEFLQNNDLEVGETVNNKQIYDGKYFVDYDGVGCLITTILDHTESNYLALDPSYVTEGTPYKYTNAELYQKYTLGDSELYFNLNSSQLNYKLYNRMNNNFYYLTSRNYNISGTYYYRTQSGSDLNLTLTDWFGYPTIIYLSSSDKYYFGLICERLTSYPNDTSKESQLSYNYYTFVELSNNAFDNVSVFLDTNNLTINNNIYEGDTIINNNGDTDEDDDEEPDTTTPGTNIPGGDGADDTEITFPQFNFNLPEINWSIGDLSNKFPFSIPFDLVAFFTVLNAEPEAPKIDANIPLGNFYTWRFQADFSQFDNYAQLIRNVEFIGFIIGLIYLTIRIVKG